MNDVLAPGQSLDQLLDRIEIVGQAGELAAPADWAQGRATFGGLVGAAAVRALEAAAPDRALRSMLLSFVGPVEPGTCAIELEHLRSGRSATHAQARLVQGGSVRASALGCLVAPRASSLAADGDPPPTMPPPEEALEAPFVPGLMPDFVRHVEMRFAIGDPPYSRSRARQMGGYCRFREPTRRVDAALVAALVDIWPAPVIPWLDRPAPASSVTWNLEIAHLDPALPSDAWWSYRATLESASHGYAHARAELWDAHGRLAAVSRQLIAVFA